MLLTVTWSLVVVHRHAGKWHENEIAWGQAFGEPHVVVHLVGNMLSELSQMQPEDGHLRFETTDSEGNHCRMAIYENGRVEASAHNVRNQGGYEND